VTYHSGIKLPFLSVVSAPTQHRMKTLKLKELLQLSLMCICYFKVLHRSDDLCNLIFKNHSKYNRLTVNNT